eukprot:scaffold1289_cov178-Amphora_coffeaeformis.AAC.9
MFSSFWPPHLLDSFLARPMTTTTFNLSLFKKEQEYYHTGILFGPLAQDGNDTKDTSSAAIVKQNRCGNFIKSTLKHFSISFNNTVDYYVAGVRCRPRRQFHNGNFSNHNTHNADESDKRGTITACIDADRCCSKNDHRDLPPGASKKQQRPCSPPRRGQESHWDIDDGFQRCRPGRLSPCLLYTRGRPSFQCAGLPTATMMTLLPPIATTPSLLCCILFITDADIIVRGSLFQHLAEGRVTIEDNHSLGPLWP